MGKWSHLANQYPVAQDKDPKRGEKVREMADALRGKPLAELAAEYDAANEAKTEAAAVEKQAGIRKDAAILALSDAVERAGLERVTTGGFNYSPSIEPYPVVEDRAALMAYGLDGNPEVLTYSPQTLETLVKASLEGEGQMPPGVGVFLKRTFSRTKASGK